MADNEWALEKYLLNKRMNEWKGLSLPHEKAYALSTTPREEDVQQKSFPLADVSNPSTLILFSFDLKYYCKCPTAILNF